MAEEKKAKKEESKSVKVEEKKTKKPKTKSQKFLAGQAKVKKEKALPNKLSKKVGRTDLFAVIKTGGKQYLVKEGDVLEIEKLDIKEKQDVNFEDVLLVFDKKDIKIGTPKVSGAKVKAKVVSQKKGDKLIVFKYKPKKRYRKKTGHRQKLTEIEIQKIEMK